MSASKDLLPDAFSTAIGVATAKINANQAGVEMLLTGYREDARAMGYDDNTAWAVLFAATSSWMTTLIECRAHHHNSSPTLIAQELAHMNAGAPR